MDVYRRYEDEDSPSHIHIPRPSRRLKESPVERDTPPRTCAATRALDTDQERTPELS